MDKIFEMEMGGEKIRARLLTEDAPITCKSFEEAMPTETFAVNAKFAGDETIGMLSFYVPPGENEVPSVEPGDIGYYPRSQTLCLFYGEIMPFGYINLFAKVLPEDLEKSVTAGKKILNAGSMPLTITMPLTGDSNRKSNRQHTNPTINKVIASINNIWETEPKDVAFMRTHKRPPMGNFPCVIYSNFDLFWGTENLHVASNLVNELELEAAKKVALGYLKRTQERLGKWGFPEATSLIEESLSSIAKIDSKEDLMTLLHCLNVYLNRLGSWIDSMIPWNKMDDNLNLLHIEDPN
tara:strand:- start:38336 stop:39220 length:885 start_codon:yes stop_codon:yes gene_type:complete